MQSKPYSPLICLPTHLGALYNLSYAKREFRITLVWIPGHVGIGSNKVADAVARDATTKGAVVAGVLSLDFKSVLI
jgi:hypothetical protein